MCKYHDGEGLGKNDVYLTILVIERELLVYTRGMGAMHLFSKSNKRKPEGGGILRDRNKINVLLIVFCNLVTSEHRIKLLIQRVHDNVEKIDRTNHGTMITMSECGKICY